jgi:ABC-type polysaccharide transport system, permease component
MSTNTPLNEAGMYKNKSSLNRKSGLHAILAHINKDRQLLILFLPCILFYSLFRYGPMYGVIIAFKKYSVFTGILKSPWVGLKYFEQFFSNPDFLLLFKNTLLLGVYSLLWTFPFPVIFAVLLNEIKHKKFKKSIQTVSYLPSFLSLVIICSMVIDFLSPGHGLINNILEALGMQRQYFISKPEWFRTIYIASDIWSGLGYGAIIYLAAISGIDTTLYEASTMDGCKRFQSMWYITIPGIFPTIATMFILKSGSIIKIGYEKVILLYTPTTYQVADIFSTYVYRKGIIDMNYSYGTAVGLFESVISLVLLLIANGVSKKLSESSLW